ncbi:hypothetical protein AAMO2058_000637800 [Amorphochlora amoebiformis]
MYTALPPQAGGSRRSTLKAMAIAATAVILVVCLYSANVSLGSAVRARPATVNMARTPMAYSSFQRARSGSACGSPGRNVFAKAFELPALPWDKEALKPHMSSETIDYHYGKHHAAYVNKLNDLTKGTAKESKSLEDLITSEGPGGIFNSAAQSWNHDFFWKCLSPTGGGAPSGAIAEAIARDFGSFDEFKAAYDAKAVGHFGSGWIWLVKDGSGKLSIVDTHDAENPLTQGLTPILTTDVWEHAYYIDYRNARPKYISDGWWSLVNWEFANVNYES